MKTRASLTILLLLIFSISSCNLFNTGQRSKSDQTLLASSTDKYGTCEQDSDCEEGQCFVALNICISVGYEELQAINSQMLQFNCQTDEDCEVDDILVQAGVGKDVAKAGEGKGITEAGSGKDLTINYYCDLNTHTCKPKASSPLGKG